MKIYVKPFILSDFFYLLVFIYLFNYSFIAFQMKMLFNKHSLRSEFYLVQISNFLWYMLILTFKESCSIKIYFLLYFACVLETRHLTFMHYYSQYAFVYLINWLRIIENPVYVNFNRYKLKLQHVVFIYKRRYGHYLS